MSPGRDLIRGVGAFGRDSSLFRHGGLDPALGSFDARVNGGHLHSRRFGSMAFFGVAAMGDQLEVAHHGSMESFGTGDVTSAVRPSMGSAAICGPRSTSSSTTRMSAPVAQSAGTSSMGWSNNM
uniref:Uncharacterized protein n=1 Tax=Arundo donax TaxID=35708 RepID=A0A0A9FK12_ARUDO